MAHLVLKLHVTLPDFTLLVSLGNFGEEGIEHEVMVLNSIADGEILREVADCEYTGYQGILTQNHILVTHTGCVHPFVIRAEFSGCQAFCVKHAVSVQIIVTLLQ